MVVFAHCATSMLDRIQPHSAAVFCCVYVSLAGVAASDASRHLELRCVLAVIRHGDRTPKQKMKVTVTQVGQSLP
jgi:hypothetical protein